MAYRLENGYTEVSPQLILDLAENLASLNEIVVALFSGLALGEKPDEAYANLVFEALREHNWRLGFAFNEERPSAKWYEADALRNL